MHRDGDEHADMDARLAQIILRQGNVNPCLTVYETVVMAKRILNEGEFMRIAHQCYEDMRVKFPLAGEYFVERLEHYTERHQQECTSKSKDLPETVLVRTAMVERLIASTKTKPS